MRDALARHDEILRTAVESNDGHTVKTTGDGIHAVFGQRHVEWTQLSVTYDEIVAFMLTEVDGLLAEPEASA